jgi:hypothetical protein
MSRQSFAEIDRTMRRTESMTEAENAGEPVLYEAATVTDRLSPLAFRLPRAAFGTENNRRNSHDLIAFRIEETLKFNAKRSF